jgi:hypothetical protein
MVFYRVRPPRSEALGSNRTLLAYRQERAEGGP